MEIKIYTSCEIVYHTNVSLFKNKGTFMSIQGNMMIAQSGGPSMVINQSLVGAILTAQKSPVIGEIYGALHGIQGILDEDFIDLRKESEETLRAVAATPSSALGSVRRKPTPEDCTAIFQVLAKYEVRYFFYIGGNDSAETADIINREAQAQGYELCSFHIPKTIDNDLRENDHTPGYGSAGRFVASAVRGDDLDNYALGGVKIDVIMGRDAGFLTAASALARQDPEDGPHLIYIPERPFSIDSFIGDVEQCMKTYGRCVIALSEGIKSADGTAVAAQFSTERDAHGNLQLSGAGLGENLAALVKERLGIKRVRADTFGFIQRSFVGVASATDSREAFDVGQAAVEAATSGEYTSGTIAIQRVSDEPYTVRYAPIALSRVAKHTRSMPDVFINEAGNNVTPAFIAYATPIIGELPYTTRFTQLRKACQ